jgi:membrane-bound metal-dependent hydrolase YbcI (DUF457 family)
MDTLTHGLAGALIAKTGFSQRIGKVATTVLVVSAVFPDSDVIVDLVGNEFLYLKYHRSLTHSFLGALFFSALLAGIFYRFGTYKKYWNLYFLSLLGILSHIFLDLPTSFGTMIFFPFSDRRVAWDMIFIIDLIFTGIIVTPQLVVWIYLNPSSRGGKSSLPLFSPFSSPFRRAGFVCFVFYLLTFSVTLFLSRLVHREVPWKVLLWVILLFTSLIVAPGIKGWIYRIDKTIPCRVGLIVLLFYMGLCWMNHWIALKKVEDYIQKQGLQVVSYAAFPQPLSPFNWSGVIKTREASYQNWFNILTPQMPEFSVFQDPPKNEYITMAENLPVVQLFLWFARFPVITYQTLGSTHIIEYFDLRFNSRLRRTPFVLEIIIGPNGEVIRQGFAN